MNTNKAWSLNISTAAQWNSGHENSIADIHLLQIRMRRKGNCLRGELQGIVLTASFKMSLYLQSCK